MRTQMIILKKKDGTKKILSVGGMETLAYLISQVRKHDIVSISFVDMQGKKTCWKKEYEKSFDVKAVASVGRQPA